MMKVVADNILFLVLAAFSALFIFLAVKHLLAIRKYNLKAEAKNLKICAILEFLCAGGLSFLAYIIKFCMP